MKSTEEQEIKTSRKECPICKSLEVIYCGEPSIYVIGKRIYDFYNNYIFPVVSENFKNVIEENHLTGVEFVELKVNAYLDGSSRKPMDVEGKCYKIVITGRTGMWRSSTGEVLTYCEGCNTVPVEYNDDLKGCSTLEEEWDGSNLFLYENQSSLILIDDTAYKVLKKAKLRNVAIKPLGGCFEV